MQIILCWFVLRDKPKLFARYLRKKHKQCFKQLFSCTLGKKKKKKLHAIWEKNANGALNNYLGERLEKKTNYCTLSKKKNTNSALNNYLGERSAKKPNFLHAIWEKNTNGALNNYLGVRLAKKNKNCLHAIQKKTQMVL